MWVLVIAAALVLPGQSEPQRTERTQSYGTFFECMMASAALNLQVAQRTVRARTHQGVVHGTVRRWQEGT